MTSQFFRHFSAPWALGKLRLWFSASTRSRVGGRCVWISFVVPPFQPQGGREGRCLLVVLGFLLIGYLTHIYAAEGENEGEGLCVLLLIWVSWWVPGRVVLRSTRPERGRLVSLGECCRTGLHPSHTSTTAPTRVAPVRAALGCPCQAGAGAGAGSPWAGAGAGAQKLGLQPPPG